jgi:hypothetical protein
MGMPLDDIFLGITPLRARSSYCTCRTTVAYIAVLSRFIGKAPRLETRRVAGIVSQPFVQCRQSVKPPALENGTVRPALASLATVRKRRFRDGATVHFPTEIGSFPIGVL